MTQILLVEDEPHLASALRLNLELEGYSVTHAETARAAASSLISSPADCIILDVMLPDRDGMEFCAHLRRAGNYTPILMLTARSSAEDRVRGLESGADDYLPKPFELSELLARVRSLLRRSQWQRPVSSPARTAFGLVEIDFDAHTVKVSGDPITLTALEFSLLRYLVDNPGRVITREELLENVWKLSPRVDTRTTDNFIARLRKRLESDPKNPSHILSVRGMGYRFQP